MLEGGAIGCTRLGRRGDRGNVGGAGREGGALQENEGRCPAEGLCGRMNMGPFGRGPCGLGRLACSGNGSSNWEVAVVMVCFFLSSDLLKGLMEVFKSRFKFTHMGLPVAACFSACAVCPRCARGACADVCVRCIRGWKLPS